MISLGPLVRREPTIEIEVIEEDEAIELEGLYPVRIAVVFLLVYSLITIDYDAIL